MTDDDRIAAWRSVLQAQHRVVRAIECDLAAVEMIPLSWYDVLLSSTQRRTDRYACRISASGSCSHAVE